MLLILDLSKGDYDFRNFKASQVQTIQVFKNSLIFKLSARLYADREIRLEFNESTETLESIAQETRILLQKGITVQVQREGENKIKLYTPLD